MRARSHIVVSFVMTCSYSKLESTSRARGRSNVEAVFTYDSVKPFLEALLLKYGLEYEKETAKIAQFFIELGFSYLTRMKLKLVTKSHHQTIEYAIDVSRLLANPEEYLEW